MYTFSTSTSRDESMFTPSVFPIRSIGARIRRSRTWICSLYDGVSVQKGLFCNVSVRDQSNGGGPGGSRLDR